MANTDDGGNAMFTEHMPAPPPFWRFFTKENMEQLEKLKENDDSIPSNLNALVPPPIPIDGKYRNFGGTFSLYQLLPSLEELQQEQLYPTSSTAPTGDEQGTGESKTGPAWTLDRAFELKKIVRSMLLNYLELIGIISQDPTCAEIKIQHLTTLYLNAHHIINEYRPHQARETLILMAEERIAKMKAEIESVKEVKAKVESLPKSLPFSAQDLTTEETSLKLNLARESSDNLAKATWSEMEEELGT